MGSSAWTWDTQQVPGQGDNGDRCPPRSPPRLDASPGDVVHTLRLPSGVGSTCVLRTPFNSTLDQLARTLDPSANDSKTLAARYFDPMCLDSFTQGVPLSNFVPPPPLPAPSEDPEPDPRFQDALGNLTVAPPTAVHGRCGTRARLSRKWSPTVLTPVSSVPLTSPPPLPPSVHEPVRCSCSMQGAGFSCPSGVGGRPPTVKVVTGDVLVDITGRNVSEYLLFTSDRLRLHR